MKQLYLLGLLSVGFLLQGAEMSEPVKGMVYRHYSGKEYEILEIALDHDLEKVVVYRALYDDPKLGKDIVWVRKLSEWNDPAVIDGTSQVRYAQVNP